MSPDQPTEVTSEPVSLLDGLATTRAIRRYTSDPIPDDHLAQIMFSATRGPTGSNRNHFRFLVLRDGPRAAKARALLGETARAAWASKRSTDGYDTGSGTQDNSPKARMARTMTWFVDNFEAAPVIVLPCLRRRHGGLTDGASIYPACQNLLLAARALGYGGVLTMWHAAVADEIREACAIPDDYDLAATIPLGVPQGSHGPVRRRPLPELVFEDGWDGSASWIADPPGTAFTQAGPPKSKN